MSPTRLFLITIAALHLLQSVAFAFTWPKLNLPGKRFGRSKTVTEPQKTVRISQFTGGTGASAQLGLLSELTDARAFQITGSDAAYVISGSSVGGRVTGRVHDQTGKMIFERTYAAPGLDENLKALTDDLIFAITGKPGLATSRIIFVSDKSGTKQIYLCDSDGADVQQVTRHRYGAVSPSLAPDRTLAAFTTYRSGFPVVTVLDLGVGYERTVTDTPGSSFGAAFSPDGQHLAFVMSFLVNPEIFVTDLRTNTAACNSDTVGDAQSTD